MKILQGMIVGLGHVALSGHWPTWEKSPRVKIAAGVDGSAARREMFSKLSHGASAFADLAQAENFPCDFVDVATPPFTHFAIVKKMLESGRHVMCEKPLVFTLEELQVLKTLARSKNLVLFTVHNWRFSPHVQKLTELVESGALGQIESVSWQVLRTGPSVTTDKNNWRLDPRQSGGGILIDHGWHAVYIILEWLKAAPIAVSARLENRLPQELAVEDTASLDLEFPGARAQIFLTWASRLRKNTAEIVGSQKIARLEDDRIVLLERSGAATETIALPSPLSQGSHHPEWFEPVSREFFVEIDEANQRGKNLAAAETCLKVLCAAQKSGGGVVAV